MRNKMRSFKYICCVALSALLVSCSGTVDSSSLPVLEASVQEIDLAAKASAEFIVTYDGVDVTSESRIFSSHTDEALSDNVFAPSEEGVYSFYAVYGQMQSNTVTVEVKNTRPVVDSKFNRQVCVIEFTGAWCINCPSGYDRMHEKLSLPSMSKYKDLINICAFHSDKEGDDPLAIEQTQDLKSLFKGLDYPSFVVDFRDTGHLDASGVSDFLPSILNSFNDYPAHCGVAVASSVTGSEAQVQVKVMSELTAEYRLVILVVENKVNCSQKTATYPDGDPNYIHNHVVREVVTSYAGTFTGEKITDDGVIITGEEASATYSFPVDDAWVLENTKVYAIVLDSDGYANNMNLCSIADGDSGYDLK